MLSHFLNITYERNRGHRLTGSKRIRAEIWDTDLKDDKWGECCGRQREAGGRVKADTAAHWDYRVQRVHVRPRCKILKLLQANRTAVILWVCSLFHRNHSISSNYATGGPTARSAVSRKTLKSNKTKCTVRRIDLQPPRVTSFLPPKDKPSNREPDCVSPAPTTAGESVSFAKTFVSVRRCATIDQS